MTIITNTFDSFLLLFVGYVCVCVSGTIPATTNNFLFVFHFASVLGLLFFNVLFFLLSFCVCLVCSVLCEIWAYFVELIKYSFVHRGAKGLDGYGDLQHFNISILILH